MASKEVLPNPELSLVASTANTQAEEELWDAEGQQSFINSSDVFFKSAQW